MAVRLTFPATHVFLRTLCVAGLIVPALVRPSGAGEWTITPRVNVEQSVTDNVRSVSDGAESDFITTANAGVSVAGIGRSLQLNFNLSFWIRERPSASNPCSEMAANQPLTAASAQTIKQRS